MIHDGVALLAIHPSKERHELIAYFFLGALLFCSILILNLESKKHVRSRAWLLNLDHLD